MALITMSVYSASLCRTVDVHAIVPLDGPLAAKAPLKSLYLLNGLYGSEQEWSHYTRIALWARERGLAVFCPAGENAFYRSVPNGGDYLRFVSEELPQIMSRFYPLSEKREDVWIGGMSMGGYGALNAAFTHPERFSKVIALSSALHFQSHMVPGHADFVMRPEYRDFLLGGGSDDTLQVVLATKPEDAPEVYLACGESDSLLPANLEFAKALKEKGYPIEEDIFPGGHDWAFWDEATKHGLAWAYR